MNDHQLLPVEAGLRYTVDFTDVLPATITLTACVFSSPSLTLAQQSDDLPNALSTIKVSGASHGLTYVLQATGTLSNGETVVKDVTLLGFNG